MSHAAAAGLRAADWRGDERLREQVKLQVEVQAKYSGYLKRQSEEIERAAAQRGIAPAGRYRLRRCRRIVERGAPAPLRRASRKRLGQAARIPGLTPAAVSLLLVHLKKRDRAA